MDQTPSEFAYRCLPLSIANAHGWEILNSAAFEAEWDGGVDRSAIKITYFEKSTHAPPVSIFGSGVLTFHGAGLFKTPPGWNMWVTGSPNMVKDSIAPLTGVVETDWSPMTFTMNWKFTRPGVKIRFEKMEPFCFFFPTPRGLVEQFRPRFEKMEENTEVLRRNTEWSTARLNFTKMLDEVRDGKRAAPAKGDSWQKHYFKGIDIDGTPGAPNHQTKLKLSKFDRYNTPDVPRAEDD